MTTKNIGSTLKQIPLGIWMLGFVSMLMDISSEMVHSLLPMFMVGTLVSVLAGIADRYVKLGIRGTDGRHRRHDGTERRESGRGVSRGRL